MTRVTLTYMGPSGLIQETVVTDAGYAEISEQAEDVLQGAGFLISAVPYEASARKTGPNHREVEMASKDVYIAPSPYLLRVDVTPDPDEVQETESEFIEVDGEEFDDY